MSDEPAAETVRLDAHGGLKWLRARLRSRAGRTLVGIDGLDGSGKATFADDIAAMVTECGGSTIRISLRKYLNPQSVRYAQGRTSPRGFYEDSYDYQKFHDEVLEPLGREGSGRYRTAAYDLAAEAPVTSPWLVAPDDAVVVIDGLFLHRKEFATSRAQKVWDYSVWLEVPFEEAQPGGCTSTTAGRPARSEQCPLLRGPVALPAGVPADGEGRPGDRELRSPHVDRRSLTSI
ncbi:MAG: hypothetical protein KIT69_01880 [Propionibacteriaceae bacterium]|nr:hypothetical protein [Propionibacteriaceae bacterium]